MKGRIDVIKKDLEACFSWKPDSDATEWDIDGLRSLLSISEIRVEITDTVLEAALEKFNGSQEPCESELIAKGVVPIAPAPLRVKLSAAELPAEVEASREEILRESAAAEGDLSYLWAEAWSIVGTILAPVNARPGLALNRDPIPPPEMEGEDFRIGENLEIHGGELIAICEGLLRRGKNWADIVPCTRHQWSLSGGLEDGGCFLDYSPGHPALALPSSGDILAEAGRHGFLPEKILSEEELRSLLADAIGDGSSLVGEPISKDSDGYIGIDINPMRIKAELILRRESGNGVPLILKKIAALISESGLRGLDGASVKAAIMEFWKSPNGTVRIKLKEGFPPERGPGRDLDFLIPFLEEEDAYAVRERLEFEPHRVMGIASLKEFPASAVSRMAFVENEQILARLGTAKPGKAGKDVDGKLLPGSPGNDPDIQVYEGLEWDDSVVVARAAGILDVGITIDGVTQLRIRPHKDARIQVTISEDKIKALVSTRLPVGTGAPVDVQRLREEVEKAGVVKGLSEEALNEVAERSLTGEIITGQIVAEGRLPMEDSTRLSLSVSGDPANQPVPVKTGDIIGTIQSGEDSGWNVFGEPLMDEKGSLKDGEYILRKEAEDGTTILVAEKGGHLVMSEGRLMVRHLLDYIGDVSLASGNIRYPGRIIIDGSVLSRVVVDGGEGVEVTQVVQAALINSGADVIIGKGIKGDGKAVIRSQGRLSLGYAEAANLLSSGNINVSKALMNCSVKCNGRLEITGKEGRIIGGIMKLKDGLICKDVGNERGTETVISFGQDYLVENQIEQVQIELKKIQDYIDKTDSMMADLENMRATNQLIIVRRKKVDALKMLEKKNRLLFLLREKFERHFDSDIKISGTAWPGVVFESHGRLIKVEEPFSSVNIFFNREIGRLEKKPLR
jgi:uncharacterized protein (DUF342 family)